MFKDKLPLIIGHRGASGYLPEHTLEAYELAIKQGADFIEPDLVSTKDGALIARHEVNITETTDVADHPEFASRKTKKIIDGIGEEGWFADDFTLAEIRTLRARQRLLFRPQEFNDLFQIPTLEEVIDLARRESKHTGRTIGIYPETKRPSYHQSVGLPLEENLVRILDANGLKGKDSPVIIQSFEVANLKKLNKRTCVRLVQLIDAEDIALEGTVTPNKKPYDFVVSGDPRTYADLLTPQGLAEIRTYADGIGPWKRYILGPSEVIKNAHEVGLFVHAWTFRNENRSLASDYGGNPVEEYLQFYCLGIDGLFSDFPDTAWTSREVIRLLPLPHCLKQADPSGHGDI